MGYNSFSDGDDDGNHLGHDLLRSAALLTLLSGLGSIGKSVFNGSPNRDDPELSTSDFISTGVLLFLVCCCCTWAFEHLFWLLTELSIFIWLISFIFSAAYGALMYPWEAHRKAALVLLMVASAVMCVVRLFGGVEGIVATIEYSPEEFLEWRQRLTALCWKIPSFVGMTGGAVVFYICEWARMRKARTNNSE